MSSMTGGLFVHMPLDFHGRARCRMGACWLASPPRHATTPPHPVACRHDRSMLPACMKACPRPQLGRWTTGCRPGNTQAKHNRQHITQPWFPTWCIPATVTHTPHVKNVSPPPDMIPTGLGCIHAPPRTQETWGSPTPHAPTPAVKCDCSCATPGQLRTCPRAPYQFGTYHHAPYRLRTCPHTPKAKETWGCVPQRRCRTSLVTL